MAELYKCMKCGWSGDAEELGTIWEWEGEGVMRGERPVADCCPECGEEDYLEEAAECTECGGVFSKDSELTIFRTEVEHKLIDLRTKQPKRVLWEHVMLCPECLKKIKTDVANGTDEYEIKEELEELDNGSI